MSILKVLEFDHYVEFVLNRPDQRNALNSELIIALKEAFEHYSMAKSCRLIILTGAGDVFSAGADLKTLKNLQAASYEQNLADSIQLASLFKQMHHCNIPILGKVNGHAIAGGCGLISLCDIIIAKPEAKFGYTETQIGFVPALVSRFLIDKVGETQARMLLLSGLIINADTAEKIGLITEAAEEFEERINFWIERFTKKVSPEATKVTKRTLQETIDMSWEEALNHAAELNAQARLTDDCKKGITAFLNKEIVEW